MTFRKIFDSFPPPKFLEPRFAGLSISDTAIRCVQFGKRDRKLYIEKHIEKALPSGAIVSGQINNVDAVVTVLSSVKKELNLGFIRVSLPEEKAYLFTNKIPIVKQEEIKSSIESKIEENVPVSPSELVFDYKLIDHTQKGHLDVVVSALPISIIDTYVEIAEKTDVSLLSLEIESQAIARALLLPTHLETMLIVNFAPGKVGLYVISNRIVHFTSTIAMKTVDMESPDFLLQEIKKLYMYWHTLKENVDKPEKKISQITVCGEGFKESSLPYISLHINTPIALGNVWVNAFNLDTIVPEISFSDSLRYATAIGLALPDEILI